MAVIFKDSEFDLRGVANFIYKAEDSKIVILLARKEYVVDTTDYNLNWKKCLDKIVRSELFDEGSLKLKNEVMVFRLNDISTNNFTEHSIGTISIYKAKRIIVAGGYRVPDSLYEEVLLWFHRLIKM